ncbi:hypothetical protein HELRODRAFT_178470 [Helobdella robusta]|uniref:C-type lectin domain-containing protein n=1 Tax=Helobdella robusta TaxID=6412 RepID=T1FD78_HELRO|nr:hypothetical protein HELRODRAFT_178470 [Helobdella robusta]ESN97027.1 hypothetical protein HELRODRAFT_178470 [Helobdella robusta]
MLITLQGIQYNILCNLDNNNNIDSKDLVDNKITSNIEQIIKFHRAYTRNVNKSWTRLACYNEKMTVIKRVKVATSALDCIRKCQKATNMNLRGINYMTSLGTCSCVPKMNVLYNITTNLTGGCLSYVAHNCPSEFDYIMEYHRCYNFQFTWLLWNESRQSCNNLLNSHPVIIDNNTENSIVRAYSSIDYYYTSLNMIWTAGYGVNATNNKTIFFWSPYPGE